MATAGPTSQLCSLFGRLRRFSTSHIETISAVGGQHSLWTSLWRVAITGQPVWGWEAHRHAVLALSNWFLPTSLQLGTTSSSCPPQLIAFTAFWLDHASSPPHFKFCDALPWWPSWAAMIRSNSLPMAPHSIDWVGSYRVTRQQRPGSQRLYYMN